MRYLSLALLLSLTTACGVSNDSQQNATSTTAPAETAAADALVGTYAMEAFLSTKANAPIVGETKASGGVYRLAIITKTDDGYMIREKACTATFKSSALETSVADSEIQKSADIVAKLEVSEGEGGLTISRKAIGLAGVELKNPETDALPTSLNDPRVVDGGLVANLSVKVLFSKLQGTANYISRSKNTFTVKLGEKGVLKGTHTDESEQVILSVSNLLMKAAQGSVKAQQDLKAENSVTLVPVDAASTCGTVKFSTIFGR